jgi:hypothetical protein
MDQLRAAFGGRCVDHDGERKGQLEFSHTKPTGLCGRGRSLAARYHDIKRNPDCYALRCRRHHMRYDAAHWTRLLAELEEGACPAPDSAEA